MVIVYYMLCCGSKHFVFTCIYIDEKKKNLHAVHTMKKYLSKIRYQQNEKDWVVRCHSDGFVFFSRLNNSQRIQMKWMVKKKTDNHIIKLNYHQYDDDQYCFIFIFFLQSHSILQVFCIHMKVLYFILFILLTTKKTLYYQFVCIFCFPFRLGLKWVWLEILRV